MLCLGVLSIAALLGAAPSVAAASACSNEAIRMIQSAGDLPECRAYEQVTPVDKGGADVDRRLPLQASSLGGGVAFFVPTPLPEATSAVPAAQNRATRTVTGWTTEPLDAPQLNVTDQIVQPTRWISADLSRGVSYSSRALTPGAHEGGDNLYLIGHDEGQSWLTATAPTRRTLQGEMVVGGFGVTGATPDLSHFTFNAQAGGEALVPGANPSVKSAYLWNDGELELLGRLPDGSPAPFSTQAVPGVVRSGSTVSADGTKAVFGEPGLGGVYMRENGTTKLVAFSERAGDDPEVPAMAQLLAISADGRYVYFKNEGPNPLTEDPMASTVGALYRYHTSDGDIELLVSAPEPNEYGIQQVLNITADGETLFFVSLQALTSDAASGQPQLYVWSHGKISLVGQYDAAWPSPQPTVAISRNGRYAEIATYGPLMGVAGTPGACPAVGLNEDGLCEEAYSYDIANDELACLSCSAAGPAEGDVGIGLASGSANPASVLDDGTYLFDTPTPLVAGDVNGKRDVYVSKDRRVHLLTPGVQLQDAFFRDASPDGTDVFAVTDARLVAQDKDRSRDVYDIRIGGGLMGQNEEGTPLTCSGEACQGTATAPPAAPTAGSAMLISPENPKSARKKPRLKKKAKARRGKHRGRQKHMTKAAPKAGKSRQMKGGR